MKAQLGLRRFICASLAKEFEVGSLTAEQKVAIAHRLDDALRESDVLRLALDMMERREREEKQINESGDVSSVS
jgi:hypothetical protein